MTSRVVFKRKLFTDVFWRIKKAKKRFVILWGSAASSKSYSAYQHFVMLCMSQKNDILVIRKHASTLENSVYDGMRKIIQKWKLEDYFSYAFSGSKRYIRFKRTGTRILFKGLDDPEKIKSISDIKYVLIEEMSELRKKDFLELNRRIRGIKGVQIFGLFNPVDKKHWIKRHFFDSVLYDKIDDIHCTYKENRFLTKEDVDELEGLKDIDENDYRIYTLGQWGTPSKGLIFSAWKVKRFEGNVMAYWLDFGFTNDPTAIGKLSKTHGELFVKEFIYEKGLTTIINKDYPDQPSIELRLFESGIKKTDLIVADSSEPREIRELRNAGYNVFAISKKKGSIKSGIKILKRWKVNIDPESTNIIDERDAYRNKYNKATDEYIDEPEDANNHHMDGIRYVAMYFARLNQL